MRKSEQVKIEKAYEHIANKHPNITNRRHLELLTRKYIMRKKMMQACLFFFGGGLLMAVCSQVSATHGDSLPLLRLLASTLAVAGSVCEIIGVFKFVKALHEPLTPNESSELELYDLIEKGGRTDIDLSEFDDSAYLRYENEKYNHASKPKKLLILMKRIPKFVCMFIVVLTVTGISSSISGVHNIMTYEERNKNAVTVHAVVVDIEESYDADSESIRYKYTYEHTYNGKTYTTSDSSSLERAIGSSKSILIDSINPEKIIVNDGKSKLTTGLICLSIGILIFVYSLFNVRDLEKPFSIFSLFWMGFAAAAIGFAVWGISWLIAGNWGGLLIILVGCPAWLIGMFLFRGVFNSTK